MIELTGIVRYGKYKGCTIKELISTSISYAKWYINNQSSRPSKSIEKTLKEYRVADGYIVKGKWPTSPLFKKYQQEYAIKDREEAMMKRLLREL